VEHHQKNITKCPVTGSNLSHFIECLDYLVSNESFDLKANADNSILVTTPRPEDNNLGFYYESEDYISHTDSSRSLFHKIYQLIRNVALNNKLKLIKRLNGNPGTLLDYGCGTGDFLELAQKTGWNVQGIEPSGQARHIAETKTGSNIQHPNELESIPSNSFDVITLWHVLEHVPNLMETVNELKRVLKPGGYLILALPNFNSRDARQYSERWAAYDVPRHLWHFSKKGVEHLAAQSDFEIKEHLPMRFDSYYVCLLSNKQSLGKYRPIKSFLDGWRSNLSASSSGEWSSLIHVLKSK
jgi:2-polyprenyl-3-methyl-5-hydroxy-6-metoxy-1,4-benzoquinol methylase